MKVAVLSSASAGGAGIAAFRAFQALADQPDLDVDFLDIELCGQVDTVVSPTDSASNREITNTHFTTDYASDTRDWIIALLGDYDVINIQWASYLISLSEILALARLKKKILFTLHDFHYITGGCHYPAGCLGFLDNCIGCPQVDERVFSQKAVIATNKLKREIFSFSNVHLAAPSAFIVNQAVRSGIVPEARAHVLRNSYSPLSPHLTRPRGSPPAMLLIADSFDEKRKGLTLAVETLKLVGQQYQGDAGRLQLHLVGGLDEEVVSRLDGIDIDVECHGHISDHGILVDIYNRCEFVLSCSYEDNWPNILVEAACYGCVPIVGKWHGCEEFVDAQKVGHKADQYSPVRFAEVILRALNHEPMSEQAVSSYVCAVREEHAPGKVAARYRSAFDSIDTAGRSVERHHTGASPVQAVSRNHLLSRLLSRNPGNSTAVYGDLIIAQDTPFGYQERINADPLRPANWTELLRYAIDSAQGSEEDWGYGISSLCIEKSKDDDAACVDSPPHSPIDK